MEGLFTNLELWLEGMGIWAYVLAPSVMAAVAVLPIPAEAPALVNGVLFGSVVGTLMTWIGALAGAWISFELARSLGRPLAARLVSPEALAKADNTVARASWTGLLVLRLLPVVAFTAINWGAGLTDVARWRFLWTTAVGILPGAIVFTASGSGLALLLESGSSAAAWIAVALVVTFFLYPLWRRRQRQTAQAAEPGA